MPNMKLLAARQNLVHAERLGQTERAKRVKARVAELEKADVKKDKLSDFTVKELKAQAADAGIEGISAMKKDDLVEALEGEN